MSYNRPNQIINIVKDAALDKASKTLKQIIILALLGGAYIALGSMFAITIAGGMSGVSISNPGIVKLVLGLTFPLGFVLVTLAGAELFTSTTAIMSVGVYTRVTPFKQLIKVWTISYFGNFIGALFVVYVLAYNSHIFSTSYYTQFVIGIADKKISGDFLTAFIKGVGANWLVCLAAFLTYSSKDIIGKITALWVPVTAFVAMGFEHSVANMFFIPMAMVLGSDITLFDFFYKNLIPVTLGNIVGGVVLVGMSYSVVYFNKK